MAFEHNEEILDLLFKKALGISYTSSSLLPGQELTHETQISNEQILPFPITSKPSSNFTWSEATNLEGGGEVYDLINVNGEVSPDLFTHLKKYENIPMSLIPGTLNRAWKPASESIKIKFKNVILGKSNFNFIINTDISNYETILNTNIAFKPVISGGVLLFLGNLSPTNSSTITMKEFYIYDGPIGIINSIPLTGLSDVNVYHEVTNSTLAAPESGDQLIYDASNNQWVAGRGVVPIANFEDLEDVDLTGVRDGMAVLYDADTNSFKASNIVLSTTNQNVEIDFDLSALSGMNLSTLNINEYSLHTTIKAIDTQQNDNFGKIISATYSASYLAIGSPYKDNSNDELNTGGVYIYDNNGFEKQLLVPPTLPPPQKHDGNILFGSSLNITDSFLAISAPEDNYVDESNAILVDGGIVYTYKFFNSSSKYGGITEPDFLFDIGTYIGNGNSGNVDGTFSETLLSLPKGLTIDSDKNLYIADYGNNKIRKITNSESSTFAIGLNQPHGIIFDSQEVIKYTSENITTSNFGIPDLSSPNQITKFGNDYYIVDTGNNKILKAASPPDTSSSVYTPLDVPVQLGQDIIPEIPDDFFGYRVAMSNDGTIVAVGDAWYDGPDGDQPNYGHVMVYQYANDMWTQLGQEIIGYTENGSAYLGISLDLSSDGTIVAVGANSANKQLEDGSFEWQGYATICQWNGSTWTELGEKIWGGTVGGSGDAVSLSSDGSIVAIGMKYNDSNEEDSGRERVYQYSTPGVTGGTWTQLGQDIYGEAPSDQSGASVSLSNDGTILAIGAPGNDGNGQYSGHVRVYQYSSSSWTQIGQDIDGEAAGDEIGWATALSLSSDGTILAISARKSNNTQGHVSIYQWNGTDTWIKVGSDIVGEGLSNSGYTVSLNGDGTTVAIGAPLSQVVRIYQTGTLESSGGTEETYNISDNTGRVQSQTYTQSSTEDNDSYRFEFAMNGDGISGATYWTSYENTYNNNTGIHTGSGATFNVDDSAVLAGEWGEVDVGTLTYIEEVSLTTNYEHIYGCPAEFRILASTNKTTWTTILHKKAEDNEISLPWQENVAQTFAIPDSITQPFRYYRYVVIKIDSESILSTTTEVNVINSNGNKYVFDEDGYNSSRKYRLQTGTYTFINVPEAHPIAILNSTKSGLINYTGDANKKFTKSVSGTTDDGTYDFYYGDVTVTVTGDFNTLSVYCYYHGYMGGENLLIYDPENARTSIGHFVLKGKLVNPFTISDYITGITKPKSIVFDPTIQQTSATIEYESSTRIDNLNNPVDMKKIDNDLYILEKTSNSLIKVDPSGNKETIIDNKLNNSDSFDTNKSVLTYNELTASVTSSFALEGDDILDMMNVDKDYYILYNDNRIVKKTEEEVGWSDETIVSGDVLNNVRNFAYDTASANFINNNQELSTVSSNYVKTGKIMKYNNCYYILDIGNNALIKTDVPAIAQEEGNSGYDFDTPLKWSRLGEVIVGEDEYDNFGRSISLSNDGTIVAIGAPYNDGNGDNSGHVRVYQYSTPGVTGGTWTQLGSDIDGEAAGDNSGYSISLNNDGTILAIGAPYNDGLHFSDAGQVRVYQYSSGSWTQVGQDIDGEAASDESGSTLSLSSDGTILAIGAPYNDGTANNAGHVRVYQYSYGSWTQLGQDIDGEAEQDRSGRRRSISLSSDGTIVAIGATENDGNGDSSGHVRVYQWNGTDTWTQLGSDIDGEAEDDRSGWSTALSSDGTTLAIGGFHSGIPGYIKIYKWNETEWIEVLLINGGDPEEEFGRNVSLSDDGTILAVGAPRNDDYSDEGAIYVYKLGSNEINSSESVIEPEEDEDGNDKGGNLLIG